GDSFAAGINTATGEERWRIARPPLANWASPAAVATKEGGVAILQDGKQLTGIAAKTGKQLWTFDMACSGIESAAVDDAKRSVPASGVTALDVTTNPTAPELVWESNKLSPSGASAVVHRGKVYTVNRAGVLNSADAKTGKVESSLRLKGPVWATPVIAG